MWLLAIAVASFMGTLLATFVLWAVYLGVAALGGLMFLLLAWRVFASKAGDAADPRVTDRALYDVTEDEKAAKGALGAKAARNLFAFSILYLFALFAALLGEAVAGVHPLELLK